jgi:hypothetical protein
LLLPGRLRGDAEEIANNNQCDLEMLWDTIEVERDLDELMQMIGRARSGAYQYRKCPLSHHPYSSIGVRGLAVKLWRMTEKKQ